MGWEYSGNPENSDKDRVRFYIGDTNPNDQQLSDEEILWLLSPEGATPESVAIAAVKQLIVRYSRDVDRTIGSLSIRYSQRVSSYKDLLRMLQNQFTYAYPIPYAGGIKQVDKDIKSSDSTMVQPNFVKDAS